MTQTSFRAVKHNLFINPENSYDQNPADYRIGGVMQEPVYQVPVSDTDKLEQRLVETWAGILNASTTW